MTLAELLTREEGPLAAAKYAEFLCQYTLRGREYPDQMLLNVVHRVTGISIALVDAQDANDPTTWGIQTFGAPWRHGDANPNHAVLVFRGRSL